MLPGFSGHLISEYFLEAQVLVDTDAAGLPLQQARARFVRWRRRAAVLGPTSTVRSVFEGSAAPLGAALGFQAASRVEAIGPNLIGAVLGSARHPVALVVSSWGDRLDPVWQGAVRWALECGAAWSLLFNGTHLRIVDAQHLYSRRYADFDLDLATDDERTFAALWHVARADRLATDVDSVDGLAAIVARSERHAASVSRSLKDGVLTASARMLGALTNGRDRGKPAADSFEQALTIVYRLLFLLFAEARGLVPLWHPVYRESYSIEALRTAAERSESSVGLWDALRAIARLAHAGCRAGDLRVTPFNGRLFAPARTPLAERRNLDDDAARQAVLALSSRVAADRAGRERIAYRDLGVEQLGAVYETLLDYRPAVRRSRVTLEPGSGVRKATGTFYTPQPIADYLIRRAIAPLVESAEPDRILALRIVDPAMGSGAFLVAACRYLASAYEHALVATGGYHASDFGEVERASIRRTIAERCLYGVDVNPMAVQLARLSLWLATLAADRPLTFLDHHLACGDSLVGAWIHLLRRPPALRRRAVERAELPLFDDEAVHRALEATLPVRFHLESVPDDTLDQVRGKERALAALAHRESALAKWKRAADLWCSIWFVNESVPAAAYSALADAIAGRSGALPDSIAERYLKAVDATASARRFFHWELEFPEVFFAASGGRLPAAGFDAVIGNPPWDMIRADAGPAEERRDARAAVDAVMRFTRDSGIYHAQSDGHANRYQLFLERAIALAKPGGRIGLVLPAGLAIDRGSARLRSHLFDSCRVDAIVGFDNRRAVFPIHRSVKFLLLSATAGTPTSEFTCRLGEQDPAALDGVDSDTRTESAALRITRDWLERVSGPNLSIPDVRSEVDLAIVDRAAALFPPLGGERGWSARFGRELNATDDRDRFGEPGAGLPIVEGKQLAPFRVRLDKARASIAVRDARELLRSTPFNRPRLAYRDVASATNRLTLIAAILPAGCVSTHTVFCLRSPLSMREQYFLCGLFNSFVVNYLVRLRVSTHVTTATIEQLPMPRRDDGPRVFGRIAGLARVLSRRSDRTAFATLQALVAGLYQLSADEFRHVLDTFPLVEDTEKRAALFAYRRL